MVPHLGNAGFSWDDGASTLRLRTPLRDFRPRHQRKRYTRESLDLSVREVTAIGTGVHEVHALLRFEDNPGGLMDLLREGADGNLLHYHHRNWCRYSEMDTDSDGNGVVDGWAASAGVGTVTYSVDGTDGAQKVVVSGGVAGNGYFVTQRIYGLAAAEAWTASVYARVSGLSNATGLLAFYYYNVGGSVISSDSVTFTNTSYARQSLARTLPAGTVYADILMGMQGTGASAAGSVWLRDAQMEIGSVLSTYLPSYPCYLIEPSGDLLETELDADRGMMGDQSVEMVLRSATSLDFRLLCAPGT